MRGEVLLSGVSVIIVSNYQPVQIYIYRIIWFCPACNRLMDGTRQTTIVDSGSVLIIQLLHYGNVKRAVITSNIKVNCCSGTLRLLISPEEQVCLYKEFILKATINHSGTL